MSIEQNPEKITPPDWAIEDLYKKAWQIVKTNKILWIFASAAGGAVSFNNNINLGNSDFDNFQKIFKDKSLPQPDTLTKVLGAATDSSSDLLSYAFSAIPVWFYLVLILELIFLFIVSIIIAVVYQAWAQGTLLDSVRLSINGSKTNINEASENTFGNLKPLIFLQIVPGLILALAFVLGFIIAGFLMLFIDGGLKVFFGLLIILISLLAFIAFLLLSLTQIWAPRLVITEKLSGKEALIRGYKIARRKFWSSMLLGLVNNTLLGILLLVFVAIVAIPVLFGLFIRSQFEFLTPLLIFLGLIIGMVVIFLFPVLTAVIHAFKATVWSLAYTNIRGKYDK